jgi:hypothetical protein
MPMTLKEFLDSPPRQGERCVSCHSELDQIDAAEPHFLTGEDQPADVDTALWQGD